MENLVVLLLTLSRLLKADIVRGKTRRNDVLGMKLKTCVHFFWRLCRTQLYLKHSSTYALKLTNVKKKLHKFRVSSQVCNSLMHILVLRDDG